MDYYSNEGGTIIEVKGPVMIITSNRPELKNGANWQSAEQSAKAYQMAIDDPDIRVIVLTGIGEYFNTGGRVDASDPEDRRKYAEMIARTTALKKKVRQPIICAINGHCLKGGMGIVADADLAVAKRTAMFGLPEVRMGGVPMVVLAQLIGSVPKKLLLEASYSSTYFDAETACRIGLVNAVTDEEDFWPTVERYIHMIVDNPKELIQMTHDAYYEMAAIPQKAERIAFAQQFLEERVLPQMTKEKQEYNV